MPKQIINPASMAPPAGYSYAAKKRGTPVFISGQVTGRTRVASQRAVLNKGMSSVRITGGRSTFRPPLGLGGPLRGRRQTG
jgi:hypothetical protein